MDDKTPLLKRLEASGLPYTYTRQVEFCNGLCSSTESGELLTVPPTCGAHCKSTGEPCRLTVPVAGARCRFHGGRSTGPKTPAGRAAVADANRRRKGTRYKVTVKKTNQPSPLPIALPPSLADRAARELERRAQLREAAQSP